MTEADDNSALSGGQQDTASLLERLLGRAITDRYVDFCRFASGAFELRVPRPVAAHALRELEGVLRRSLKASLEIRPAEEPIDPLHAKVMEELSKLGIESAAIERAIETLRPRTNQANQIRQITASLGLASDGDVAEAWISLAKTAGKAHEHSFHESLLVDDEFRQAFQQPCDMVLRAVALALERRYSVIMRRVEEVAAMSNKAQAAKLFAAEVPGAMPLQWHFYQRLTTADWLPHLLTQRLMGPPLPEFGGTAVNAGRFGEWPAGSYLRRMAESAVANVRGQVATAVRNVGELGALGQWCDNHQIDPTWLFDRLLRMLRAGFVPAIAYGVVSWLAKVRETHIDRAVEVLQELLMSANVEQWVYVGQDEAIRTLLTEGRLHGTGNTAKRVGELISYLASIGQSGYMES